MGGDVTVVAGEHDLKKDSGDEQQRKALEFIVHEDYNKDKNNGVGPDDIALVPVDRPFTLNGKVRAIKLPEANSYPVGRAVASGWGSITSLPIFQILPNILQVCSLFIKCVLSKN